MTTLETRPVERAQRGGRRPRRDLSGKISGGKPAWRHLTNSLDLQRAFSDDQIANIHDTALRVLEELGIRVLNPRAIDLFRRAGARIDAADGMVFIDRGIVATALASAPSSFTIGGATVDRDILIGGRAAAFACVGGPPNVMDIDRGRRSGTEADMLDFFRLSQHFDVLHMQGSTVEPQDVPIHIRHYAQTSGQLRLSDKPMFAYARGTAQAEDTWQMIRLGRGLSDDEFRAKPYCFSVINTNSPRQLDSPMCNGIIDFAQAGQATIITPFTLMGAMAPVTIAGALTLQHAEALAGITLSQIVRPGAPVVYGSFTSNVDMKSGSPAFGTPEFVRAAFGAGQLARHVNLPWRGSGATASNAPDAQSAYEAMNSAWGTLLGGVNVMLHAAGWLESGLSASLEKFVLDVEMLQMFAHLFQSAKQETEGIFEAIAEVPPGGHFFGTAHTLARYESAFYEPLVSDWRNFGQWTDDGARTATDRANTIWKRTIADFEPPPIDPARLDAVEDFIARRTVEGGAPPET
jgi:trimethylamine--corrinoid protein Co-methyltransferase